MRLARHRRGVRIEVRFEGLRKEKNPATVCRFYRIRLELSRGFTALPGLSQPGPKLLGQLSQPPVSKQCTTTGIRCNYFSSMQQYATVCISIQREISRFTIRYSIEHAQNHLHSWDPIAGSSSIGIHLFFQRSQPGQCSVRIAPNRRLASTWTNGLRDRSSRLCCNSCQYCVRTVAM